MDSYSRLIDHIDAFVRKYYKNQLLRGGLLFLAIFLFTYVTAVVFEYFSRFDHLMRAILFYSFILGNGYVVMAFVVRPLLRLYKFGSRIDQEQASEIIGEFFPTVSDRLKNTLQLKSDLDKNEGNIELLRASVMQRSSELSVIPFTKAIDYRSNRKYVKFILPLFLVILVVGITAPSLLFQGTERIINYNRDFKPKAPFSFLVKEGDIVVEEGQDAIVELRLKGNELPDKVYLISENGRFPMVRTRKDLFKGRIIKPKKSGTYYFSANDFVSSNYPLTVYGKSLIGKLSAHLDYPSYTGRSDETILQAGDLMVPEGTKIKWTVEAKHVSMIMASFQDEMKRLKGNSISFVHRIRSSGDVRFVLTNDFTGKKVSNTFHLEQIKDAYPVISVVAESDSLLDGVRYFAGSISDDYGLSSLRFNYTIIKPNGKRLTKSLKVQSVSGTNQLFDFGVDFRREEVALEDKIEYYFSVSDNDAVNGNKTTRSEMFTYELPTLNELNEERSNDQQEINKNLQHLMKQADAFKKDVNKLKKDMLNSKSTDWNQHQKVEQLQQQQQEISDELNRLKEQMNRSVEEKQQLSEIDKEILEKQEMIEKLLEEVMDDELMKLLEELDKLLQENNPTDLKKKMDAIEQNSEELKNQLDRSLEMLKKLQLNEKIDDVQKELEALSKEQKELTDDIKSKELSKEEGLQKQEEINKRFQELREDLKSLQELNDSLAKPMDLQSTENIENKISDELNDSKESLSKGKEQKAGESQQNASGDMEKLSQQLEQDQAASNQQQQEEDIESLRQILENLVAMSIEQEALMTHFSRVSSSDPAYRKYAKRQRRIMDDTELLKDSLLMLAKRQPKIASFVDKELADISSNYSLIIDHLDEHSKRELLVHQQYVMTSFNNLALLLNESLESMQQQMQNAKPGSGSCNKPGGKGKGSPSMQSGDMKEMLKKQLEQLQKGNQQGGSKPGSKPGSGSGEGNGMLGNKETAKMAAEQAAIRRRLEQLKNQLNEDGSGKGNKLNPLLKELEEQEKALVNKRASSELLKRQQDIMTRMLESEKALNERGLEEKRESKEGNNSNFGNQIRFDEYKKSKLGQIELLRSVDPLYRIYYKDKANQFLSIGL